MLRQTFAHIPGIGTTTEKQLWQQGIRDWDHAGTAAVQLSAKRRQQIVHYAQASHQQLADRNTRYFADLLNAAEHWRLFHAFRDRVAYLDIETTGLMWPSDHITTIALYDGRDVHHYVHGHNLDQFKHDIAAYDLLVTYNGKCFDVPCIEACLGCRLPQAHLDLRYVLKSLGYSGGLKHCERELGLERPGLEDVDGYIAVLLWHEFKRTGRRSALDTLLAYNVEDVLMLERLAVLAYNKKVAATPFATTHALAAPCVTTNPFTADQDLLRRIAGQELCRSW